MSPWQQWVTSGRSATGDLGAGRQRNSQGLSRSWSRATSEVADALLPILWKGKLRNRPGHSLAPGKGGDSHALPRGLCSLADRKLTNPFQGASSARQTSDGEDGGLWRRAQKLRNLQAAAECTAPHSLHYLLCVSSQLPNSYLNVSSFAFPGTSLCSLFLPDQLHFFQTRIHFPLSVF